VGTGEVLEQAGNFLAKQATISNTAKQLTVANSDDVAAGHQVMHRTGAVRASGCVCAFMRAGVRPVCSVARRLMYCRTDLSTD
jgi:hypothetical protein